MKIKYQYRIFVLIGFFGLPATAQILDDSTKELYSHKTVRFRTENQLVTNYGASQGDTSLNEFSQKADFIYQPSGIYQNLGVFGTAGRPLYYRLPASVGLRNGMNAFDYMVPGKDEIRYYNTRSPYTEAQYMQGARQRAMLRVTFTQNILPGLNVAAHYQRLTAMRTINVTQSEERQSDHHSAWISGNYSDSTGRYRVWGHYQHLNHLQYETGGIAFGNERPSYRDSLFTNPEIYPAMLNNNARNRELRHNWYISQSWKPFGRGIYLRTSHYRQKQINRYTDPLPSMGFYGSGNLFFQKVPGGQIPDTLYGERIFRLWENTGYIGYQDSSIDANFYIKRRDIKFYANLFAFTRDRAEWVYGGQFEGRLGPGRIQLAGEWISPEEYDLKSEWKWAGFVANARWFVFKPSLIQQELISKNLIYQTSFSSTKALHLSVQQNIRFGKWSFGPAFEHFSVQQGIAFGSDFIPFQAKGNSTIQLIKIRIAGQAGKAFHTENQFIRSVTSGAVISGMPVFMFHSTHWADIFRRRPGYAIQVGFNLDWRYNWQAEGFNPLTSQWFIQNQTSIPPYFLVDVFAHIRIQRVRIYAKVHNTMQGVGSPGYFASPNYQAQRRLFEIGLVWTFYD